MKESILLAPGADGNELMGSLARHGVNSMNLRVCGSGELARMALLRSGIPVPEEFVSVREENALIGQAARKVEYFAKDAAVSYADVKQIAAALRRVRCLVPGADEARELEDHLSLGIFQEKNRALLEVYRRYMGMLQERGRVDTVMLIRRAATQSDPLNAEFSFLEEYPLNPLEETLLKRVAGDRPPVRRSVRDLFSVDPSKEERKISVWNCYGAPNEVESILTEIYREKALDRCTVAVTDEDVYGQLFFDYAILYHIPITFGCGIPVINSNPARLLILYARWISGGFSSASALLEMLRSPAFDWKALSDQFPETPKEDFRWDTFFDVLGALRLTRDAVTNAQRLAGFRKALEEEASLPAGSTRAQKNLRRRQLCLPFLEVMARELALSPDAFLRKYARIRRGKRTGSEELLMMLDLAASRAVCEEIRVVLAAGGTEPVRERRQDREMEDIIRNVLRMRVGIQSSAPGKLHVTAVSRAVCSLRENLYLAGLSAAEYPGSPRENYLLLDSDLRLFGEGAGPMTSDGVIQHRRDQFLRLMDVAAGLGVPVTVTYAGHNVSGLTLDNASSLLYEVRQRMSGPGSGPAADPKEQIRQIGYFEPAISRTRHVGEAYISRKPIERPAPVSPDETPVPWNLDQAWSASALEQFFRCPRRFLLQYLLKIPEPEREDPFTVISALDTGNLAHSLMERLADPRMTREAFLALAGQSFDWFLAAHPPLIADRAAGEKEEFLQMMETAFDMDPRLETVLKEEDIQAVHPTGVKIHGYPDRVEKLEDGTVRIVDFKTGRNPVFQQDDIETCLQVVIYAYLMERSGYAVSCGEYRCLRPGTRVTCRWDDAMRKALEDRLKEFRDAMLTGVFPPAAQPDACTWCRYGSVCGRNP